MQNPIYGAQPIMQPGLAGAQPGFQPPNFSGLQPMNGFSQRFPQLGMQSMVRPAMPQPMMQQPMQAQMGQLPPQQVQNAMRMRMGMQ
jgi:hypothetical protein